MLISLPNVLLATAALLIVISAIQPLARRLMLPDTALLAMVGVVIGGLAAFLLATPLTDRFDDAARTLLNFPISSQGFLYIFLPLLVFQGALQIEVRELARDVVPVLLLAIVAVIVATVAIGFALAPIAPVSLTACLMLGAIVATTDPAAVVGIFRSIGANPRLTRLVEGEALLNDAVAIIIFELLLESLTSHHAAGLLTAGWLFVLSFAGSLLIGTLLARALLLAVPWLDEITAGEVTLTLALPYVAYILCDEFLDFSGIVAAAAAGLTISAYGPSTFRPASWRFLQQVWAQLAFWASSLVFVLASMLVPRLLGSVNWRDVLMVLVVIAASTLGRAAVLFGLMPLFALTRLSEAVPFGFKVTIVWGALRGAITLALALAVTENQALDPAIKHVVASVATGFVLFTLFVNGTTLRTLVRRLRLDQLSPIDQALRHQVLAVALGDVHDRLDARATELGFTAASRTPVLERYAARAAEEADRNSFDVEISDRDRVTLALITLASRERSILLDLFSVQDLPRPMLEALLRAAEQMIDGARTGGRAGYLRAARRRLAATPTIRLAQWLHLRLGIDRPLARCMTQRFEALLVLHLISVSLVTFLDRRMRRVLGPRVGEIVGEILDRRTMLLNDAVDSLRIQYPGYADALETRLLRQMGMRLEGDAFEELRQDSLIGDELRDRLGRDLDDRREAARRRLQLNLPAGIDRQARQMPLLAGLPEAMLHHLTGRLALRYVAPAEIILRRGERVRTVVFVSSGEIERVEAGGDTVTLRHGDVFGAVEALTRRRSLATLRATRFCQLLVLPATTFRRLAAEAPALRQALLF